MAALKQHLQTCELIRDIKISEQQRKQGIAGITPSPPAARRSTRKSRVDFGPVPAMEGTPTNRSSGNMETGQSSNSARLPPSNPFGSAQAGPSMAPLQQTSSHPPSTQEHSPALPTRPKAAPATSAEIVYKAPSTTTRRSDVHYLPNNIRPNPAAETYNIPGGFPRHDGPMNDSRASSLHDYSPSVPRRKEVKSEAPGNAQFSAEKARNEKSFPTAPNRAPPAPPVLSAPPPYTEASRPSQPGGLPAYQDEDTNSKATHASPLSSHDPRFDTFGRAESAKINQLVSLGIPPSEAEELLAQTGGDVNAAAELRFSGHGNGSDGQVAGQQPLQPGTLPSPIGPASGGRRNPRAR